MEYRLRCCSSEKTNAIIRVRGVAREGISQFQDLQGKSETMAQQENREGVCTWNKVLFFNSRVKLFGHGKLQSKWEEAYKVINSSSHGAITLPNDEGTLFMVNGQRLKLFLEPDKKLEEIDVINFYLLSEF
jgi:hypothetical protein